MLAENKDQTNQGIEGGSGFDKANQQSNNGNNNIQKQIKAQIEINQQKDWLQSNQDHSGQAVAGKM